VAARSVNRQVAVVAVLLAGVLAALLGGWGVTGWQDVRARQATTALAPVAAASVRAGELARELRGELDQLVVREARRPYFHYQNLFHDPRASVGPSVTPSPLAIGPDDPLVLGYFQIDANAKVTTPAINDEFAQLSDTKRLVEHRAFRDAVTAQLAVQLKPERAKAEVHSAVKVAEVAEVADVPRGGRAAHTYEIDEGSYAQNSNANAVYGHPDGVATKLEMVGASPDTPPPKPNLPKRFVRTLQATITLSISSLEWHTLSFLDAPALVAVRQVSTPDGNFTQGFVVDRGALTRWLAGHAGDLVAELRTSNERDRDGEGAATDLVAGWELSVAPNPSSRATAAREAERIATSFLIRFVTSGVIAVLAALLVVWWVARAERYALERSQFAAAAAHELRTPLAGLQLYGDMLADGLGDPTKLRDYAKRMSEEASRLGRVVSNVLGFSQLERGNLSIDPRPGNLAVALRELVQTVEPALDRAGAVIDLEVPDELAACFDRDALARIIGNLLDNAEKYARAADDRTIHLAAARVGRTIEITVRDHGAGVANPAKLFRAFARGVASDGPAGLGLGLALSRSLARAMGGDLAYRPASDGGAIFVVELRQPDG
jgi:signal transduction histidine kinase